MNLLFHNMRKGKKGQIASILTLALLIFIISAFLVVNLGKDKLQDNRVKYAAQAGVLAGGSSACILLNSMANLNDSMILNFAGFTLQVQLMLASWMLDYVKAIIAATSTLVPFNEAAGLNTVLAVTTLCITTGSLALMIGGATKLGNVIYDYIDDLNEKLPKNSRDSARQYAFSNAGIDEPKIPFSKSGCSDAWCYSLIETNFDEFMRVLPSKNKADTNYSTSTIAFDWDDSRTDHIVNNKVSVTVTPVQKVSLSVITFSEVASNADTINAYLDTQDLGWLGPIIKFGVNNAGIVIALIWSTAALIAALAVVLGALAVVEYALAATFYAICAACSWFFCACCWACPYGVYYTTAASWLVGAAAEALVASIAFFIIYDATPPGEIPCFVWDKNNTANSYPLSVTVSRTTNPESINYGIYTTDWPEKTQSASGTVQDGAIFPPSQMFDIIPSF
jgi:hypothetical protein